jgi:sugar fermentation stimulation protein A
MNFKSELIEGQLLKRYKRFFADVEYLDKTTQKKISLTIHVPNTGSLKTVIAKPEQPQKCWFTLSDDPQRKLKGTLIAVQTLEGSWVGVDTSIPNKVVQEAAQEMRLKHWSGFPFYRSEYKISKETRLDGVFYRKNDDLENPDQKKHFIEIKNTTLKKVVDGVAQAQFPDAVTERGQKHLKELMHLIQQGHEAELIFAIQRSDCQVFSVAEDIDPEYASLFRQAIKKGLIVTPVIVSIDQTQASLTHQVLKVV